MKFLNLVLVLCLSNMILSCNQNKLKERELSIREREVAIKEKELGLSSNDTTSIAIASSTKIETPIFLMKEITDLAKKYFLVYKSKLEYKDVAIGIYNAYTGDFTGDGKEDVVIYYDLEPTNGGNYMAGQGLVLYKNTGDNAVFINKYEPKYLFSFDKINNGNIYISKDDYTEDDPRCCPSIHTIMELAVNGTKITEQQK
jgi:hypothetical protein